MSKWLTIGIAEKWAHNSEVVAIGLEDNRFYNLDLKEDDFFRNKITAWDLFGVTEGFRPVKRRNGWTTIGAPKVTRYYSKKQIVEVFERYRKPVREFLLLRPEYCIMRLDTIIKLDRPYYEPRGTDNLFRQYLHLGNGKPYKLLIKDFRWVQYWENLNPELWEEKIGHWENYLRSNKHMVYAIGRSLDFKGQGRKSSWICGLHCFKVD